MKREKSTGPRTDPCDFCDELERSFFFILKNHTSAPIRRERASPTSKVKREASRNEFKEKCVVPDRFESFREVDKSENCPRTMFGFGLRKEQNLIQRRSSRAETGLVGRENGIRLQKEE